MMTGCGKIQFEDGYLDFKRLFIKSGNIQI